MSSVMQFEVFSGGTVNFDLKTCANCETKACVTACNVPNLACVLELKDGLPALKVTQEEAKRGACIECLACELACMTDGIGGITFSLPMPEWDQFVAGAAKRGETPGFQRS